MRIQGLGQKYREEVGNHGHRRDRVVHDMGVYVHLSGKGVVEHMVLDPLHLISTCFPSSVVLWDSHLRYL